MTDGSAPAGPGRTAEESRPKIPGPGGGIRRSDSDLQAARSSANRTAPSPLPPGFIALGHIVRPHGVHGAVIICPYTDNPEAILDGRGLELLSPDGAERRPAAPRKGKPAAQGLIVKFAEISDRQAAAALQGWRLGLDRSRLPEPPEDEVYWADLIGLELLTPDGRSLGRVAHLMEAGAGLILVAVPADGSGRELLLPFQEQFVVRLDLEGGRLILDPPEGLLEL